MLDGAIIGAGTIALGAAGFLGYAARSRSAAVFGPSVYRGQRSRQALALTFDDGPSESTPKLLDILARHGVRATFFMCGQNVRRCPAVARAVMTSGHEIGNHTDSHPHLSLRSPGFIEREITVAQETILAATGLTPQLFRAPFGVRWYGLRPIQRRLGLMGVMWTVIGRDWKWPAARVSKLVLDRAANGGIICLHDGRQTRPSPDISATLAAVDSLIPALRDRGYQFETISQILLP